MQLTYTQRSTPGGNITSLKEELEITTNTAGKHFPAHTFEIYSKALMVSLMITLSVFFWISNVAADDDLPRWEVGIGGGVASIPQYMGSDERYTLAVPLPFIIYRSKRLNFDRNGLRVNLFGTDELFVDASLKLGLAVKNDNLARSGMPDLNFILQAGPRINWQIYTTEQSTWAIRLPWRGVMGIKGDYLGWVSEPDLNVEFKPADDLTLRFNAGALFASQKYNETYYSVDPLYANAGRPAYSAKGGLHSLSVGAYASWAINDRLRVFTTLRYRNLSAGVVSGSPLVKTPHYLIAAFGLVWSFYQSDEKVSYRVENDEL
jgi:outer membrane scaffolding protein for murein synthesis (MipA/OmpV family)